MAGYCANVKVWLKNDLPLKKPYIICTHFLKQEVGAFFDMLGRLV